MRARDWTAWGEALVERKLGLLREALGHVIADALGSEIILGRRGRQKSGSHERQKNAESEEQREARAAPNRLPRKSAAHVTRCPAVSSCGHAHRRRNLARPGARGQRAPHAVRFGGLVRRRPRRAGDGPARPHFVRDIGCAYILPVLPLPDSHSTSAWPAALIGALFLTLHALVQRRRRFPRPGTREPWPHRPRRRVYAGRGRSLAYPFIQPHLREAIVRSALVRHRAARLRSRQQGPRYTRPASLPWPQEHPADRVLYRVVAPAVQGLLAISTAMRLCAHDHKSKP
jgi:hypothetical protein